MYTAKQQIEGQMLKYFIGQPIEIRRQVLASAGGDYDNFIKAILSTWERECALPADELIQQRLKKVKIHIRAPRLGAHGKLFTLRYWPEAKRLKEKGAKYPEIVEYLKIYRKYTISPAYLRRLMEALA